MSKRAVKREACNLTWGLIRQYLDAGQPHNDAIDHGGATEKALVHADKLKAALEEIMDEMSRRGVQAQHKSRSRLKFSPRDLAILGGDPSL